MTDQDGVRPRRRRAPREESPGGGVALRIFALADYAAVAPDQKLYLSGANIQNQYASTFPLTLSQLYVAVLIGVPWNLASDPHEIRIRMLDGERHPIGPDPLLDARIETGRPPGTRAGEEIAVPLVMSLSGLAIDTEMLVYFHLEV